MSDTHTFFNLAIILLLYIIRILIVALFSGLQSFRNSVILIGGGIGGPFIMVIILSIIIVATDFIFLQKR